MKRNEVIVEINGVKFYYGGYNQNGWHLIYTSDENFHLNSEENIFPTEKDCKRIYRNYYA